MFSARFPVFNPNDEILEFSNPFKSEFWPPKCNVCNISTKIDDTGYHYVYRLWNSERIFRKLVCFAKHSRSNWSCHEMQNCPVQKGPVELVDDIETNTLGQATKDLKSSWTAGRYVRQFTKPDGWAIHPFKIRSGQAQCWSSIATGGTLASLNSPSVSEETSFLIGRLSIIEKIHCGSIYLPAFWWFSISLIWVILMPQFRPRTNFSKSFKNRGLFQTLPNITIFAGGDGI